MKTTTTTQDIISISAWQAGYVLGACYLVGFLVFIGLAYALISFLGFAFGAWVYNVVSKFTGGLEIEVADYGLETRATGGYGTADEQAESA